MSAWVARLGRALRVMLGAPDYESYLAHMRERHPDERPLSEAELFLRRQEGKGRPGARCC